MDKFRACVLAVVLVSLSCCSRDDGDNIFFEASISDIAAYSATVTVKHNATNRDAYYGFVVKGRVFDVYAEIERFLTSSEGKIQEAVHYQRKSVFQIKKLLPRTEFTFIVFGMDENGKLYGTPASICFQTIGSTFTATINPNWIIEYMGHRVYKDNDYSLITVDLVGDVEERFFLATIHHKEFFTGGDDWKKGMQEAVFVTETIDTQDVQSVLLLKLERIQKLETLQPTLVLRVLSRAANALAVVTAPVSAKLPAVVKRVRNPVPVP